ncbi:MAG: sulfite exporter TauE/SafE family protein [Hyphomonas sp.]|uniref:sulfite exporter TauE/SafE family protein n=1 Tax=Hyphomonas sp. TaxID=87 RepID=UPI001837C7FA|nr:sulfite exporter TauE/SafE family protein [Hyphomonas sp.]MBU3920213.1 sulfite exporter TauE/SafE family protein [Alphaproteobacteria bacterium]MBA3069584.1 sulfite exporter TauE/SafE family protein [Hyphomonas sp.]MBU4063255.1 sulfite exporter TauE/SafE family protein [Alphaproteobacteria bacterium]MBU4164073.1 sulfite exporter TauE/SafE family protein [Alphaproteobacteria bacterium]MBU4569079.1 sulfite exporter TauE/SafE family protein [Alphaproteobacteria bacterium]
MSFSTVAVLLLTVLVTTFISGIFGMAGGVIFMGVLAALVPVATAMIIHGAIQIFSNGYRAFLWRAHIDWSVFRRYALGSGAAVALLFALSWRPDQQAVYILLGLTTLLVWLPKSVADLDIQKRYQAELAGFTVQALNTVAGVAGPLLDLFFVRTSLTRQTIVATKAVTQVLAHTVKIVFWSIPVIAAAGVGALPPWWLIVAAIPLSMLGTTLGGKVLEKMTDIDFKKWMKYLVTAVGAVMLIKAAGWI